MNNELRPLFFSSTGLKYTISQINDGSPDYRAINITNELMGDTRHLGAVAPSFWENIGSRLMFSPRNGAKLAVYNQAYPTYYVYVNGKYVFERPQAAEPAAHFYSSGGTPAKGSYPFGTQPSGFPPNALFVPGGRNGDAKSAVEPTSRFPKSRVYYNASTGDFE